MFHFIYFSFSLSLFLIQSSCPVCFCLTDTLSLTTAPCKNHTMLCLITSTWPKLAPCSNRTNVKSGVSALSSTSTAFGTAAANTRLDSHTNGIDESLKQQVLAEEEAAMNQYKVFYLLNISDGNLRLCV